MTNERVFYVERWLIGRRIVYTLWGTIYGETGTDRFLVKPKTDQLAYAWTEVDLRIYAETQGIDVIGKQVVDFDFDRAYFALDKFRTCQFLFKKKCRLFFDLWNVIDDISHTLSTDLVEINASMQIISDKLYDKLFYGINLQGITPTGCRYTPWIVVEESLFLRYFFRTAYSKLLKLIDQTPPIL